MHKLLIFCFVTVLICCDTTTQHETKRRYSSYLVEYAGLTPESYKAVIRMGGTARDYRKRVTDIPLDEYPLDAPKPVHEMMSFSAMQGFVHNLPDMHKSYEECIYSDLERAGASFAYFVEKPRDYLYYLYIEGRD